MRAKTQVVAPTEVTPIALPLRSATPPRSGAPLSVKWLPSVCVATIFSGMPASRKTKMSVLPAAPSSTSPEITAFDEVGAAPEGHELDVDVLRAEEALVDGDDERARQRVVAQDRGADLDRGLGTDDGRPQRAGGGDAGGGDEEATPADGWHSKASFYRAPEGARRLTSYRFLHTVGRTCDRTTSRAPFTIDDDRGARQLPGCRRRRLDHARAAGRAQRPRHRAGGRAGRPRRARRR